MSMKKIVLLFLLIWVRIALNGQEMSFEEDLKIAEADYGTCYNIGNYMLCPEQKIIRVGKLFGTAEVDCFGYFPSSELVYDKDTMIIFGGQVFFDDSGLNINWKTVELLSYRDGYCEFTDGKTLYYLYYYRIEKKNETYDKNTYKLDIEKRQEYRKDNELTEGFSVKGNTFYFYDSPILESFDIPNLRTIVSKGGVETNYMTDGKQVIFGGGKGGYSITEKNGKEYVLAEKWIIKDVDLPSLRVLGRDLLVDKNALYYCENVIPFNKLNGFKIIMRELYDNK